MRSQITLAQVRDGTSHTYLLGEKQLNSAVYDTGANHGDDWSMYTGYQDDICRCGYSPPMSDFSAQRTPAASAARIQAGGTPLSAKGPYDG